jgi:hypothetical protein
VEFDSIRIRVRDEAVQFGNGLDAIGDFQKKSFVGMSLIGPCSHPNKPADHRQAIGDAMIGFVARCETVRCSTAVMQRVRHGLIHNNLITTSKSARE